MATTIYLASPGNRRFAELAKGFPVLLSFSQTPEHVMQNASTFSRILLDSGAFSMHTTGKTVEISEYQDWVSRFPYVDAVAGLDSIEGDHALSLRNYSQMECFPTIHDTDPTDGGYLDELISISREQGRNWLGVGISPNPTRLGRDEWLRSTLDRVPSDIHVHGFALRVYSHLPRFDSFDSTAWQRNAISIRRTLGDWLMHDESVELAIAKIYRSARLPRDLSKRQRDLPL